LFLLERPVGSEGIGGMIFFLAGVIVAVVVLRADLLRRRISLLQLVRGHFLTLLDVVCTALTIGIVADLVVFLAPDVFADRAVPLDSPVTWAILAGILIFAFLWKEGRRQAQFQRPSGILASEWLILGGAYQLIASFISSVSEWRGVSQDLDARIAYIAAMAAGGILLAVIVPPFLKGYEGHRVIGHLAQQTETVQAEYTPPTWECPNPERWHMADSVSTELEVIEFLKALVVAMKPQLIVETGTFLGYSTIKMAEGLKANGFGRIITIEYDPEIFAKAKERIEASGLGRWIENRLESSVETRIEGKIDILFSDSKLAIREEEIRRLLPQVDPRGLILIHDASSQYKSVREFALRMEQEGLISTVLLSTPRGLVIAQKHDGRK
jgi:predicted O-methyltransferase YrrM